MERDGKIKGNSYDNRGFILNQDQKMLSNYVHFLLSKAIYEKDENGYIVASVPGYQGFFSQGQNIEEARENLVDAMESVIFHKIQHNDEKIIQEIKSFTSMQQLAYA